MSNLNAEIRQAINVFDTGKAKELLQEALQNPNAETYYLAAILAGTEVEKHTYLQKTLELDPYHEKAHQELAKLDIPIQPNTSSSEAETTENSSQSSRMFSSSSTRYGLPMIFLAVGMMVSYFLIQPRFEPLAFISAFSPNRAPQGFANAFIFERIIDDWRFFMNRPSRVFNSTSILGIITYNVSSLVIVLFAISIITQPYLNSGIWNKIRNFIGVLAGIWLFSTLFIGMIYIFSGGNIVFDLPRPMRGIIDNASSIVITAWAFWSCLIFYILFVFARIRAQ